MSRATFATTILVSVVVAAADVAVRPVPPSPLPVNRLIANLNARLEKDPGDVQATFTLGRVHYFAFAGATDTLNTTARSTGVPNLYDFIGSPGKNDNVIVQAAQPLEENARLEHLRNAVTLLSRAVTLRTGQGNEDAGRLALGLACALEEGAGWAAMAGPVAPIEPSTEAWMDAAIEYYGRAFDAAAEKDGAIQRRPIWGLQSLVAYEAGNSYERLVNRRSRSLSNDERLRLARVKEFRTTVARVPPGAITPIVFSLERKTELHQLVTDRTVRFDLNGSGLPQRYGWVRGDTAILVWDPSASGHIRSGRQLFGSVTWWMFWDDGYQSLSGLDDDANGWVEGGELGGLGIWRDHNEDGISNPGEVVPLAKTAIAALAAHATGKTRDAAMHHAGVRLRDGRSFPTFDWVATGR